MVRAAGVAPATFPMSRDCSAVELRALESIDGVSVCQAAGTECWRTRLRSTSVAFDEQFLVEIVLSTFVLECGSYDLPPNLRIVIVNGTVC